MRVGRGSQSNLILAKVDNTGLFFTSGQWDAIFLYTSGEGPSFFLDRVKVIWPSYQVSVDKMIFQSHAIYNLDWLVCDLDPTPPNENLGEFQFDWQFYKTKKVSDIVCPPLSVKLASLVNSHHAGLSDLKTSSPTRSATSCILLIAFPYPPSALHSNHLHL